MKVKYLDLKILILFFFFKFLFFNLFPINYEYSIVDVVSYFSHYDQKYLDEYTAINANTLVYPYLIFFISKIFFVKNFYVIAKLISALSYLFLFLSLKNINNIFNFKNYNLILLILFINPLIWIYTSRISVDIFPSSLVLYSMSIILVYKNSFKSILISLIIFLFSILLKPSLLILLPLPVLLILFYDKNYGVNFVIASFFSLIIIIGVLIYYFYSVANFGFFISTVNNLNYPRNFLFIISNFFIYLGMLFIFCMPIIFFIKYKKISLNNLFLVIIFFFFGYSSNYFFGEIDLGIYTFLSPNYLKGFYFSFAIFFIIIIKNFFIEKNYENKKLFIIILFSIVFYILALSFFRPAQRYLIPAMLLMYIMLFSIVDVKKYFIIIFLIFFSFSCYSSLNHINRSFVAKDVIEYLVKNELLNLTNGGVVTDSFNWVGVRKNLNYDERYIITVKYNNIECIKEFKLLITYIGKNYCLVKK